MDVMTTIAVIIMIITSFVLKWPLKLFCDQTINQKKMLTHITIMSKEIEFNEENIKHLKCLFNLDINVRRLICLFV